VKPGRQTYRCIKSRKNYIYYLSWTDIGGRHNWREQTTQTNGRARYFRKEEACAL